MKLKYLLSILFFAIILGGISYSQENTLSNIEIIDNLIDESLIQLENKLLITGKENFYNILTEAENEEQNYIANSIKNKFGDYNFLINYQPEADTGKNIFTVLIKNPALKVEYIKVRSDNVLGSKIVDRKVSVRYDTEVKNIKDSTLVFSNKFNKESKSSFDFNSLGMIEDRRYSFAGSVLPEDSAFDKILTPALIILATASAIILFFVIRSK